MRVFLDTISGPYKGKVIQLEPGISLRVGRSGKANVILADDCELAPVHFAVSCDDNECNLFDWGTGYGTFQNREKVYKSILSNGDIIKAGQTTMVAYIERDVVRASVGGEIIKESPNALLGKLHQILRDQQRPLYALLDAARDPLVLRLLGQYQGEYQSLFEGETADELAEVAPYLVSLPTSSSFLETLAYNGWGKGWGVYLTSSEPFKRVRKHCRFLQYVRDQRGDTLYFRYYDPKVLRVFLPTCQPSQAVDFFGPVDCFFAEADTPTFIAQFSSSMVCQLQLSATIIHDEEYRLS